MTEIVFVNDIGGWGGAERVLESVVGHHATDDELCLIVGTQGRLRDAARSHGVETVVERIPEDSRNFSGLYRWGKRVANEITERNPDLVYLNNLRSILFVSPHLRGTNLLWHEHNIQPSVVRRVAVNGLGVTFPDRIVAVSNAVARSYVRPIRRRKVDVVYNGLPRVPSDHEISHDFGEHYDVTPNDFIVLHPSSLQCWKGQSSLIRAAADICDERDNVRFLFLGDVNSETKYVRELRELTERLGVEKEVFFLEFIEDVVDAFVQSDVVVHTSIRPDPLPTVILEAMSTATPVIATAVGGVPEIVVDGETGYLVDTESPPQISNAISSLIDSPEMAIEMGRRGYDRFEQRFTEKRFLRDISAQIEAAIS